MTHKRKHLFVALLTIIRLMESHIKKQILQHPSIHRKKYFTVCDVGAGYSTAQFIQKILGCDYITAKKLQKNIY